MNILLETNAYTSWLFLYSSVCNHDGELTVPWDIKPFTENLSALAQSIWYSSNGRNIQFYRESSSSEGRPQVTAGLDQ